MPAGSWDGEAGPPMSLSLGALAAASPPRDDLERHISSVLLVVGEPYRARATGSERAQGPVATKDEAVFGEGTQTGRHVDSALAVARRTPFPADQPLQWPGFGAPMSERDSDIEFDFFEEAGYAEAPAERPAAGPSAPRPTADRPHAAPAPDRADQLRDPRRRPARLRVNRAARIGAEDDVRDYMEKSGEAGKRVAGARS